MSAHLKYLFLILPLLAFGATGGCTCAPNDTSNGAGPDESDAFGERLKTFAATRPLIEDVSKAIERQPWSNSAASDTDLLKRPPHFYPMYYPGTELSPYPDFEAAMGVVAWIDEVNDFRVKNTRALIGLMWCRDGTVRVFRVRFTHP